MLVPQLRGTSVPPVEFLASPALLVDELQLAISFRETMPDGTTQSAAVHMALGPRGTASVTGGTFDNLYLTTYFATWWGVSHQGEAWWPTGDGTAGPASIPVLARGSVDPILQYTWELTGHEVLDEDAFMARLSQALQETAKTDPVQAREAREALTRLGIQVP